MLKFILRLFPFFLFIAYVQITMAEGTDNQFVLSLSSNPNIVANYPLTEDLLSKIEQLKKEIEDLPPEPETSNTGNDNSIEGLIASISARPKLTELLRKNNLSPKDYVIGVMALQATLAAIIDIEDKKILFNEKNTISLDNLKFGQKYIDRIRAILDN
ncbi:Uncharacterised protein [Candidatus Bartonella washoeensis]|uniref:Uncharacterized protein n=1 Tax=Candidatus Bartonella washoeensis Sb944nv TaxID=1094563 RepID=J0YVU8_9HYPH|nr:hypothetical protein [Bartonella washoeensis]EJF79228.1 hypothetical protein MCQ_00769 [Bartonella washoeensis Sb944nv]SPU28003.1 Uncharacterised protein [Bartonella washoeensis]